VAQYKDDNEKALQLIAGKVTYPDNIPKDQ
jgi:hypothetical protein